MGSCVTTGRAKISVLMALLAMPAVLGLFSGCATLRRPKKAAGPIAPDTATLLRVAHAAVAQKLPKLDKERLQNTRVRYHYHRDPAKGYWDEDFTVAFDVKGSETRTVAEDRPVLKSEEIRVAIRLDGRAMVEKLEHTTVNPDLPPGDDKRHHTTRSLDVAGGSFYPLGTKVLLRTPEHARLLSIARKSIARYLPDQEIGDLELLNTWYYENVAAGRDAADAHFELEFRVKKSLRTTQSGDRIRSDWDEIEVRIDRAGRVKQDDVRKRPGWYIRAAD